MSERPIQVGDLVYVPRGCLKCSARAGHIFTVGQIRSPDGIGYRCSNCGEEFETTELGANTGTDWWLLPLSFLRRIPPVEEIDRMELAEQIEQHQRILERITA